MHLSLRPIFPWPVVVLASLAVLTLTIWAYQQKFRGTSGRWRWVAFGLRLAAVLMCLFAALRPSVLIDEKQKQDSVVLFLIDASRSMTTTDEVGGQSRWSVAEKALVEGQKQVEGKSKELTLKSFRFDNELRDYNADDQVVPDGRESALGTILLQAIKDAQGSRIASIILISDGASNGGISPLAAAQQLKAQQVPVLTVGVGSVDAGKNSSDLAARDLVAGPTVFVKNRPQIRGIIGTRGFGGKSIEVELFVEGDPRPVDTQTVKVPEGADVVPVTNLKYVPETPGEKRLTLKVKSQSGEPELVASNNEVSTYLDVLKGGLKVLYIQGPDFSWDPKYLISGIDPAREINTELRWVREPARNGQGLLKDADFVPGQYDVYILGGVPADHFTRPQIALLARAVKNGAGLMMLGGRSSFGEGGWGNTELNAVLPSDVGPNDGEVVPGDEGVKVVPSTSGLDNYVVRLGSSPTESAAIWAKLAPITGYNRLGRPKITANVLAQAGRDPVMIALDDIGKGRSLEFGGETWSWARTEREAYARFWRQVILWLARRENKGEDQVKLKLDARRVAVGQKLELTASARDGKNEPILDAQFDASFTPVKNGRAEGKAEPIPLPPQGEEAKGAIFANVPAGEYEVNVKGKRGGREFAATKARFMVYEDDRELENPAADPALLRQIAEITGGTSLASEELGKHLKELGPEAAEYVQQIDKRLWDNWPFFLIFTALLTAEWALRKSKGWV